MNSSYAFGSVLEAYYPESLENLAVRYLNSTKMSKPQACFKLAIFSLLLILIHTTGLNFFALDVQKRYQQSANYSSILSNEFVRSQHKSHKQKTFHFIFLY